MKPNQTLLDLLLEVQTLDRVPRMGYPLRGVVDSESVTEHSWHVVFLVWAHAPHIPDLESGRALELALVHDLAEVRFGDLPQTAARYLAPGAKQAAEMAAAREILAPAGDRAVELLAEYQAGLTREAKLVKACDKLQLMLKVATYERWGAGGLGEFWENEANFRDGGFPIVDQLYQELRERRSRSHGASGRPSDAP